jgi:hypothetical protein
MMCEDFHCCGLSGEEEVNCMPLIPRRQIYWQSLLLQATQTQRCASLLSETHHEHEDYENHDIAGILPQIKPMTVFIAVLLSSNVDEFDVVCILPSNAGNVYYQIGGGGLYVSYIQIPCEALNENKTYIWIKKLITLNHNLNYFQLHSIKNMTCLLLNVRQKTGTYNINYACLVRIIPYISNQRLPIHLVLQESTINTNKYSRC